MRCVEIVTGKALADKKRLGKHIMEKITSMEDEDDFVYGRKNTPQRHLIQRLMLSIRGIQLCRFVKDVLQDVEGE